MVIQRLKLEIIKKCDQPVSSLTSLQPLQSINGLEMFGFLSPHIIQVTMNFSHSPIKLRCSKSSCGEKVHPFLLFSGDNTPIFCSMSPCWRDQITPVGPKNDGGR